MANDWTGNANSIYKTLGASNHTEGEREADDFYATEPKAIDLLLDYDGLVLPDGGIWEPSCGSGCLSERLIARGHRVVSTDLVDRGYGEGGINFFDQTAMPDGCTCIITNPPYKFATDYVLHALRLLPVGGLLCLFLKTTFAEGKERYQRIFGTTPPKLILQCSERVLCAKNAEFDRMRDGGGSAVAYAWWVWEKGLSGGVTILDWINHPKRVVAVQLGLF